MTTACPLASVQPSRSRDSRDPCAPLPSRAERRRRHGRRARRAIITTTHRLRTRHHSVSPGTPRYCRNHLSLLTESIHATVSIPLAGRPTAPTRPHLSTTSVSRHQRATRIESIKATTGIISTVTTKWRTEGLRAAAEEARLTQIAPCYRGGSRQQRKSSTKNAANRESEEKQCTRVILACTRT